MNIELLKPEYNALFNLVSNFTETASKVIASSVIEKISEAVKGKIGDDNIEPESISISFTIKELSAIKSGFVELVKNEKSNTLNVLGYIGLTKTLKIHGAFMESLNELIQEFEEVTIDITLDK